MYQIPDDPIIRCMEATEVHGFPAYMVTRYGNVINIARGKVIAKIPDKDGYNKVNLWRGNKMYTKRLCRVVAEAFIPNPENLPQINHKDENRTNDSADNLEWCDAKYNNNYGTRIERVRRKLGRAVIAIDSNGNLIEFPSMSYATQETKISRNRITRAINTGNTLTGYVWRLKNEAHR